MDTTKGSDMGNPGSHQRSYNACWCMLILNRKKSFRNTLRLVQRQPLQGFRFKQWKYWDVYRMPPRAIKKKTVGGTARRAMHLPLYSEKR